MTSAAVARRERGRQEMREAILVAARRILADEGVDALSMRAVARAIGYSPAALYEYFTAKEDLEDSLYFEGAGGLEGRLQTTLASLPPSATAAEALTALGHAYRAFAREQPELFRLIFFRRGSVAPPVRPPDGGSSGGFGSLINVVTRGVENGEFVSVPTPVLSLTAWSAVHGFVALELSGVLSGGPPGMPRGEDGSPSLDDVFAASLDLSVTGIRRR
jgi:AcrR family transcriptional regulator